MKMFENMFNELLKKCNTSVDDVGPVLLGVIGMLVGTTLLGFNIINNEAAMVMGLIITFGIIILFLLIPVLESLIDFLVNYVTRGEHGAKLCISKMIAPKSAYTIELLDGSYRKRHALPKVKTAWFIIVGAVMLVVGILSVLPFMVTVTVSLTVLVVVGVLRLARFTYDTSKRLSQHISDPNAHKGESE